MTEDVTTYTFQGVRYYLVSKRWKILALVCVLLFVDLFSFGFFSFINDVTSVYFKIEPSVTDLQATVNIVGRVLGSLLVCFCGDLMSFRNMTTLASGLNALGALLVAVGVAVKTFSIVVVGACLNGFASAMLLSLILVLPANWFPPKERGKANAAAMVARRLAYLASTQTSTRAMGVSYNSEQFTHGLSPTEMENITIKFKTAFCSVFGSLTVVSAVCCVLSMLYVEQHPPVCDEVKNSEDTADERTPMLHKDSSYSFKKELKYVKRVLVNPSFLLIASVYAFMTTERPLGVTLATSLILNEFPETDDQFVGIMLCVGIIAASVCSPISGQILDKFSKPRLTFLCFATIVISALAVFSICFKIHNKAGVFTAFLIMWAMRDMALVCINHRIIGIMSHEPETVRIKAFSIPVIMTSVAGSFSVTIIRILLVNYGSAIAVLFPMPFLIFCVFAYIFLWSYLRDGEWKDISAKSEVFPETR